MNALQIKKSGMLWKLARKGGLPSDGMVADKVNNKYNRMLRAKFNASLISRQELTSQLKDSERPIDFCDFTRYTILGVLYWLAAAACILWIGGMIVGPMLSVIVVGLLKLIGYDLSWRGYEQLGTAIWIIAATISLIAVVIKFRDEIFYGLSWPIRCLIRRLNKNKDHIPYAEREAQKAAVAYNKAEVRKAFVQSLKGKTCFRMEVVE